MTEKNPGKSITPYLMFGGRCEEAIGFYKDVLGAKLEMLMRFSESPDPVPEGMLAPGFEEKVMHCAFVIRGTTLLASDGCDTGSGFSGFSLTLTVPSEEEARAIFPRLAEGGQVTMPLNQTFWSPCFGMLTDRFGLGWMVMVPGEM